MHKKLLCLLLAAVMLWPLLAACGNREKAIDVVKNGISEYVLVCPAATDERSKAENSAALTLYEAILKKTDVALERSTDKLEKDEAPPAEAKEILVGATNRTESLSTLEKLRAKDHVITYLNERIVIVGGTAEATVEAVERFIETYINGEEKRVTVFKNRYDLSKYDYAFGYLSINDVPLSKYRIVYPANAKESTGADLASYFTAVALADYLLEYAGLALDIVADNKSPGEYEILIGKTERSASKAHAGTALQNDEYLLLQSGNHIVMLGNSYMVSGAAGALMNLYLAPDKRGEDVNATNLPTAATPQTYTFKKATSAILMIGDGMGNSHIDATLASEKLEHFTARDLPHQSTCTTASQSVLDNKKGYTDSAAAATALATGYKTFNGYVGMDASKQSRQNVRELAHESGARTGVLTTDTITGATPAGFLCHHSSRSDSSKLQKQIDRLNEEAKIDYCKGSVNDLAKHARNALLQLSKGGSPFFLMIEEAHIDKRSHEGNVSMSRMQDCVVRYNRCITYVICFVMLHPDTALIITADHETGGLQLNENGEYTFTNQTSADYWQHTNANAPIFALGEGVDELVRTGVETDNTLVAKHIAGIFGSNNFGQ